MGRLIRVRSEVDPHLELAAIAARFEGGPRAVLFESVKGHDAPVLTGLYWSRELLAELMQREEHSLPQYVSGCIKAWQSQPVPAGDDRARADLRRPVHGGRPTAHSGAGARPAGRRAVLRRRRGHRPRPGDRGAQCVDPALYDSRRANPAHQHRRRAAPGALPRQGPGSRRDPPVLAQLRRRSRPALRGRHAGRGRPCRHRRARHRERIPRRTARARRGQEAAGARGRQRDVRARVRNRPRRARRRRPVRGGDRLLRAPGAAAP